jgi:uncharacterized protein (DUF433 family)
MQTSQIMGRGVYTMMEAAKLTGLTPSVVERWAFGYREYSGIVDPDMPRIGRYKAISFLTLMELYLMRRLRDEGIRPEKFRIAAEELAKIRGIAHPFASEHIEDFLQHDNKDFYLRATSDQWLQLTGKQRHQQVMDIAVGPFLHEVEFESEFIRRWFPESANRLIVVDPAVKFGEPVITGTRIPTASIADQLIAGDPAEFVADCYGLSVAQVAAAEGFERRFGRAA